MLVGGDKEAATKLDVGTAFTFGDPFGVLLKKGVKLVSRGDFTPF